MRLTDHFGKGYEFVIEIDSDDVKEKFPNLDAVIKGHSFSADFLMTRLYNAFRKQRAPNSPPLRESGISVCKDQHSFAIQAADVFGNFFTSYVFYKLGNTSKKRTIKGQIFENVFGDYITLEDIGNSIKLEGQNDFELQIDGAFTTKFGRYCE